MCLSVRFSPSSEEPGIGGRMQVTGAAVPMGWSVWQILCSYNKGEITAYHFVCTQIQGHMHTFFLRGLKFCQQIRQRCSTAKSRSVDNPAAVKSANKQANTKLEARTRGSNQEQGLPPWFSHARYVKLEKQLSFTKTRNWEFSNFSKARWGGRKMTGSCTSHADVHIYYISTMLSRKLFDDRHCSLTHPRLLLTPYLANISFP